MRKKRRSRAYSVRFESFTSLHFSWASVPLPKDHRTKEKSQCVKARHQQTEQGTAHHFFFLEFKLAPPSLLYTQNAPCCLYTAGEHVRMVNESHFEPTEMNKRWLMNTLRVYVQQYSKPTVAAQIPPPSTPHRINITTSIALALQK